MAEAGTARPARRGGILGGTNGPALVTLAILAHVGFNMVMPFLPLYVQQLGVTDPGLVVLWSGAIIGTAPLVAAFAAPFWGAIGDRFGSKLMLQRAFFASMVLFVGMGLASEVMQLFVLRLLFGLVGGFGVLLVALAAESVPRERATEAVGSLQGVQLASIAIGPALGGPVADLMGLRSAFFVTAGVYLLALVVATLGIRGGRVDRAATGGPKPPFGWPTRLPSLRAPGVAWLASLALILFLVQTIERSMGPVLPVYVAVLGTPPAAVASVAGGLIAASGFAAAASAALLGRATRRFTTSAVLLASLAGAAAFCLLMGGASTLWQLVAARCGMALLTGGVAALCYGAALGAAREGRANSTVGLLSTASFLGLATGPIAAGLFALGDLRHVFLADGVALMATAGFVLVVLRPQAARAERR